jgi:hypothetical protein
MGHGPWAAPAESTYRGGEKDVAEAELAKAINNYNPDYQLGSS